MVLELTGSRLVAPFLGTSLVVWTALIGVIMTSLCVGNWLGGCLADRRPEARLLGRILLLAAAIAGDTMSVPGRTRSSPLSSGSPSTST